MARKPSGVGGAGTNVAVGGGGTGVSVGGSTGVVGIVGALVGIVGDIVVGTGVALGAEVTVGALAVSVANIR